MAETWLECSSKKKNHPELRAVWVFHHWMFLGSSLKWSATGFSHGDDLKKPYEDLPRNLTRKAAHNMSGTFFARFSASVPILINSSVVIDHILSWFILISPLPWLGYVMVYPSEVNQTYGCEALKPGGWAHKPWLAMDFIPISHEVESTRKILGGLVSHTRVTWYVNRKNIRKIQNRFF